MAKQQELHTVRHPSPTLGRADGYDVGVGCYGRMRSGPVYSSTNNMYLFTYVCASFDVNERHNFVNLIARTQISVK